MLLLLAQYRLVRVVCTSYKIPPNCVVDQDAVDVMGTFQYLLSMGFVLAILTGMNWPDRFAYVFTFERRQPRGFFFLAIYAFSGIGWGSLMLFPSLAGFTLTGITPAYMIPLIAVVVGAVVLLTWHLWMAYCTNSWAGFVAYAMSRGVLVFFFAMYLFVSLSHQGVGFHLHHYAVGWLAASLAEFNHPLSLILLACGTAVFVQGLSAYGADAIIYHSQDRLWFTDSTGQRVSSPGISEQAEQFFLEHCDFH